MTDNQFKWAKKEYEKIYPNRKFEELKLSSMNEFLGKLIENKQLTTKNRVFKNHDKLS